MRPVILVVSFGTSYRDSLKNAIEAIELDVQTAYPQYEVRRAFTSQMVINKLKKRDGVNIDNVQEAMARMRVEGVRRVVVQSTHVINGYEYEKMVKDVGAHARYFEDIRMGAPLLDSVEDYKTLVSELAETIPSVNMPSAVVFMGHGTSHYSNSAYAALEYAFRDAGYKNVFIGTAEGYPDLKTVLTHVRADGFKNVCLVPLLVVAGDHANNDMAGEENSWKSIFQSNNFSVRCITQGIGEYHAVRQHFVRHIAAAIGQ